ncbi:MAG: hypothetical protein RJB38_91 [Pseudomonadota bacterium]|jgi:ABC-type uncharacterized transport system involved in gliding motility auxiliary subunit
MQKPNLNHLKKNLQSRAVAFGTHSAMTTVLVVSILGVLNFLGHRNPGKLDLTKDKLHTLSDQTKKVVRELKSSVKFVYFGKMDQGEQSRAFLENYRSLNPGKIELEIVDPNREPVRARQAGIRTLGTLQIVSGARDSQVSELVEEKVTNALIKLSKNTTPKLCVLTGHGEKSFTATDSEGFDSVRKGLVNQAYDVKETNLVTEGKIPEDCNALAIWGGTKAYFPQEIGLIRDYLAKGGRALMAIDLDIRGNEPSPELITLLDQWYIKPGKALVLDPFSRVLNLDPSVIILPTFSKDHPVTKGFELNAAFPFARPLEIRSGAPAGLNVQWLARSTPKSWAEKSFSELATGQVQKNGEDQAGPLDAVISVEGKAKDSTATKNTRLVVFGSSLFANNNFSRMMGNADLFLNAASWVMEDESMISIRPKDSTGSKIELSQNQGTLIFILTVIAMPLVIATGGIGFWAYRKRL